MTLAVLRCGRCKEPLDDSLGYAVDIFGEPVCRPCHEAEWALDEDTE